MKCPHCGHWNQPSFPRCFKCGAPLDAKDAAAPAWREKFEKPHKDKIRVLYDDADAQPTVEEFASVPPEPDSKEETLSEEMLRLKDRRERGEKYLETLREQTAREEKTDGAQGVRVTYADGRTAPPRPQNDRPEDTSLRENGDEFFDLDDDAADEPYDDPYDAMYADSLPPTGPAVSASRRRKKRKHMRSPFAVAVWLVRILVVIAVAFCIWQGWMVVSKYMEEKNVSAESVNALIETCDVDGYPGHRITILADEGTQCYIGELTKSYVAVNGVITITAADYSF